MPTYKEIPLAAARAFMKAWNKDQVIILTWDKAHGRTSVTTYGRTVDDCVQAADGGNKMKKVMGWPDELCHAKPARAK